MGAVLSLSAIGTLAPPLLLGGLAWLAKRQGWLFAGCEPGPVDLPFLATWALVQVTAAWLVGMLAGALSGVLTLLVLLSSGLFLRRARVLNRAWLLRDAAFTLLLLVPGGLLLVVLWRVTTLASNAGSLVDRARPAADHLLLQLLLLMPAAETALRLRHATNPGSGVVSGLSGAVLVSSPDLTQDGHVRPNAVAHITTVEFDSVVSTNELGLRGGPVTARRPGERRLLTLGDSFTMAREVDREETFTERVRQGLSERGEPWRAWNGGVSGQSTPGAVETLRRLRPMVQPDLVVLTFNLSNDLLDNARELDPSVGGTGPELHPAQPPNAWAEPTARLRELAARSALFSQLTVWALLMSGPENSVVRAHAREVEMTLEPDLLEELLPATERALEDFEALCLETGVECLIGLAPPSYQVHDERAGPTYEAFGLDPSHADPQRQVVAIRRMTSLPVLDLTPKLRAASDERLYYAYDVHWTPEGHRVVAEAYLAEI